MESAATDKEFLSDITWDYDEDSDLCITLDDERNYDPSAWTMGGENHIWMLPELEESLAWLH